MKLAIIIAAPIAIALTVLLYIGYSFESIDFTWGDEA